MNEGEVLRHGAPRTLTIIGDTGAQLLIDFKNAAGSSLISGPVLATLVNGKYEKSLKFPKNTGSSTTYTVTMTEAQTGVSGATSSSMFDMTGNLNGASGTPKVKTLTFNILGVRKRGVCGSASWAQPLKCAAAGLSPALNGVPDHT